MQRQKKPAAHYHHHHLYNDCQNNFPTLVFSSEKNAAFHPIDILTGSSLRKQARKTANKRDILNI